jgi:hypothetical protein
MLELYHAEPGANWMRLLLAGTRPRWLPLADARPGCLVAAGHDRQSLQG